MPSLCCAGNGIQKSLHAWQALYQPSPSPQSLLVFACEMSEARSPEHMRTSMMCRVTHGMIYSWART